MNLSLPITAIPCSDPKHKVGLVPYHKAILYWPQTSDWPADRFGSRVSNLQLFQFGLGALCQMYVKTDLCDHIGDRLLVLTERNTLPDKVLRVAARLG
jgi:hypothetical protein